MNQKDKELLLKDLCGRLPYGVMLNIDYYDLQGDEKLKNRDVVLSHGNICHCFGNTNWVSVKPYLRPMSSMTEEEKKELECLFDAKNITNDSICFLEGGTLEEYEAQIPFSFCSKLIDWFNVHHFDHRGLIEKGLAIEVTKENNPYKE